MLNKYFALIITLTLVLTLSSFASAGVGIKWTQESLIVNEGDSACMTYQVYNPFSEETFVKVGISEELKGILSVQDTESVRIPAQTSSQDAIPVEFCFNVPKVYKKDCWAGDFFVCERSCAEEPAVYDGDVIVQSVPGALAGNSGAGGSAATMAVSAPLRLRVACNAQPRDYTLFYVLIGVVALVCLLMVMKFRKPREQRYEEELKALKSKIALEKKRK